MTIKEIKAFAKEAMHRYGWNKGTATLMAVKNLCPELRDELRNTWRNKKKSNIWDYMEDDKINDFLAWVTEKLCQK